MQLRKPLLALVPFLATVLSQTAEPYTDPDNGITFYGLTEVVHQVTYGYVFPPDETATEFIGEIVAPVEAGWIGISPGGAMINNLLVVGYSDGENVVGSTRFAKAYTPPEILTGTTLTSLASTTVNETHWKWVFRCENCTSWEGGSIDTSSTGVPAWAFGDIAPSDPTDPASELTQHSDFGFFGIDFSEAHASAEDYERWIAKTS
ncbi:cellobiose dehydrogenase [Moniliophthora roreri]|uniref:Putative cellobiose dehydrogenase n=1 Tax=Moniliophthora roreri TaxID=221103 RepID=A0A0W0FT22_MONRR|nr:cellobiose dehydrogenase [Moniliophthora roreri]